MASPVKESVSSPRKRKRTPLEAGPFVLRSLLDDIPLSAEGDSGDIHINCVEYWSGNLYIGTSAAELLHFFQIPPDPADATGKPSFILASRLRPAFSESSTTNPGRPGVQQILLLPRAAKACILCNWTVTFYSLPELSPVFGTTQVKNCNWIGGVDLNDKQSEDVGASTGVTVLLSLNKRIQVVRIGEDARVIRKIDFAASTYSIRRGSFACVADSRSYALIDVEQQLKIPLMPISSLDDSQPGGALGQAQSIASGGNDGISRSASTATRSRPTSGLFEHPAHIRSSSLGGFIASGLRRPEVRPAESEEPVFQEASTPVRSGTPVPPADATDKPLPVPSIGHDASSQAQAPRQPPPRSVTPTPNVQVLLKPHLASPSPEEFLIVTGTNPGDPGIGMFVNLDGDPTRPTIEFDTYPIQIAVDGGDTDPGSSKTSFSDVEEGYVLASLEREFQDGIHYGLEIQRWDENVGEDEPTKYWLECPMPESESDSAGNPPNPMPVGVRSVVGSEETNFQEVVARLCKRRFYPFTPGGLDASTFSLKSQDSRTATTLERLRKEKELFDHSLDSSQDEESLPEAWEATRNAEEEEYAKKISGSVASLAVWTRNRVFWAMRNPLLLQLEAGLESSLAAVEDVSSVRRQKLFQVLESFKDRVEKTELEFYTFSYVKQRAGLLLFINFLHSEEDPFSDADLTNMEKVLVASLLDPRVVLALIPGLRNEIIEGKKGIWVYGGVKATLQHYIGSDNFGKVGDKFDAIKSDVLYFLKRFLTSWRKMKGFGSVADESEVFRTVDASLLGVLLEIDQHSPKGLGRMGSVRAELYELVDTGVDCFDRAVALLESYNRLFVLSRLYQSRKMAGDVLATWKRIIEGEPDEGGEFTDGEQRMREYLTKISSQTLVQEYAVWLANRNPKLGVQVFADDRGRATKFEPSHVVSILRAHAPDAVKYYLEHLVFGKGHTQYVNELIMYYLDVVLHALQTSQDARDATRASYESYKALRPPKPTYRQVLTDNAPAGDEVWHSRLRLLQLLGGAHDYDPAAIRARIAAASIDIEDRDTGEVDVLLVPETIILDGRERRHEHALRLLVHRLGDYDTALNYCLRGGASLYSSSVFAVDANIPPPSSSSSGSKKKSKKQPAPKPRRQSLPPTQDEQAGLFRVLLGEFLKVDDLSDRVEQTGNLLERFGAWFEIEEVLSVIPDDWAVDVVAGFLERAIRRLVAERRETTVARGLSGTENLAVAFDRVVMLEKGKPVLEAGS